MGADGYEPLGRSEKRGCAVAGLVGLASLFILFGVAALGDCPSDCSWGKDPLLNVLLPFGVITASVFFLVRWAVNRRS